VTPAQRHAGKDGLLLSRRTAVYEAAKARNPERWSGATRNWEPVTVVHLNPAKNTSDSNHHEERNLKLKKAA
jgi:putative transposase